MAERYIQLVQEDTKRAEYMALKHPYAFTLLSIIAMRACRTCNNPNGLKLGEALIGDWEGSGFSRQNYRTALKFLVVNRFLEILETNRNRKKSTTGLTTEGTKVKLLNSTIYDINIQDGNHRPNHCPTTAQPLPNHEQEGKELYKKVKKKDTPKPPIEKSAFAEFVTFSKEEHQKLLDSHGSEKVAVLIEILNSYKGSSGKTYDSDYHTMVTGGWVLKRFEKDQLTKKQASYENPKQSAQKRQLEEYNKHNGSFNDNVLRFER